MKNQFRIGLICSALVLSYLPTQASIVNPKAVIKKAQAKLEAEALRPFAKLAVDFLPDLVAKTGDKEKAIQLIINYKQLSIELELINQILKELQSELINVPPLKTVLLTLPIRLIKTRKKKKEKELQALQNQYPELKNIGLVRWIIKSLHGEGSTLIVTVFELFDKLRPKEEKIFGPEKPDLIEMIQKKTNAALSPFALVAVEFLPTLVSKAGGKEKAVQLIINHKLLKIKILLINQLLKEIESELENVPASIKSALKIIYRFIKSENIYEQKNLQKLETEYPELIKIGLIRWIVPPILGGNPISILSKIFEPLEPKKEKEPDWRIKSMRGKQ